MAERQAYLQGTRYRRPLPFYGQGPPLEFLRECASSVEDLTPLTCGCVLRAGVLQEGTLIDVLNVLPVRDARVGPQEGILEGLLDHF